MYMEEDFQRQLDKFWEIWSAASSSSSIGAAELQFHPDVHYQTYDFINLTLK
ncbi:hypothetical protein SK128_004590, partial [Halocaridina rubra]